MVPYDTVSSNMSVDSDDTGPRRQVYLRRGIFDLYQAAVAEINNNVAASIGTLQGGLAEWAVQFNQKVDISLTEVINAVGHELKASNHELDLRTTQ